MNPWRARSAARAGAPAISTGALRVPGEAVLAGAERWAAAFRSAGHAPGHRLLVALPTGAPLAQVLQAGLWEGLSLVPVAPSTDLAAAVRQADAVAVVAEPGPEQGVAGWTWGVSGSEGPGAPPERLRPAGPATPMARLLCAPSGGGPWAGLLDDNLDHAVDAVLDALRPSRARWLSVLPWHSPAGLLVDLLPALQGAQEIARPGGDEAPVPEVASLVQRWQPTHAVLPMATVRELRTLWGDLAPLEGLLGGLVSGPGLDRDLAGDLRRTRLRTHRGAAELSCMVTLGEPGIWRTGALGRPVGCTIADGPGGSLLISGRPVAGARWQDGQLHLVDRRDPVPVVLA